MTHIASTKRALIFGAMVLLAGAAPAADSPRERLLLDFNWRFQLGDAPDAGTNFDYPEVKDLAKTKNGEVGLEGNLVSGDPTRIDPTAPDLGSHISFVQPGFDDRGWRQLNLPHDWAVELPFDEKADYKHGFKPVGPDYPQNSIGWYRRTFELPAADQGKALWLEFDGVFRNSLVWLNGHCLGRHLSGYSSFRYDISRFANFGGKNELVVRVDASRFEGWFYEGAGIYRHVWLVKTSPIHIVPDGIFVWSEFSNNVPVGPALLQLRATVANTETNPGATTATAEVDWKIIAPGGETIPEGGAHETEGIRPGSETEFSREIAIHSPVLWSPESPKLYHLITTVESNDKIVDQKETAFGLRTVAFDATNGFLLNGKPYTIKGTCNHQDHAGVGLAIPDALQYWRVAKLKEMGGNAIRTSHNPPTPELLDACDRLGLLVMDENRRMDTNAWELNELNDFIRRDRNHPGIFIWSIGNEESLQGTDQGAAMAAMMQDFVHSLDPTRRCTVAMNGNWGKGFSTVIDVQGFNYHTANISKFHAAHPAQPAIGTETASTRVTRGIYADDQTLGYVAAYATNGIERPWQWWSYYATNPFTSGGFVWTGFDYRGEPTPYKWPCINSHFGILDMCGFPKDIYYYYQAWWTDRPVLHLMPHWNWPDKIGQVIPVRVFSNCREVELFLNGKSLGRQTMKPNEFLDWNVNYEPGTLSAKGYPGGKLVMETKVETTGAPAAIRLVPDRKQIRADNEDVGIVEVAVVDRQGRVVPVADNEISFRVQGGKILGVGNGDPSSHEPDQADRRRVFNGYAQVVVRPTPPSRRLILTATAPGLKAVTLKIDVEKAAPRPAAP